VTTNLVYYTLIVGLMLIGAPSLNLLHNLGRELVAQRMERDARHEFFLILLGKSQSFHDQQRVGDLMARTSEDVRMLNYLTSPGISVAIQGVVNLIVPIIIIWIRYPDELLTIPLIFTAVFLILLRRYMDQLGPATEQLREEFGQMEANLTESISGIDVVKSIVRESYEKQRFLDRAKKYRSAFIGRAIVEGRYLPLLLYGLTITLGLAHAIYLRLQGSIEIGQIIAYVGILLNLRQPTFISIWIFALIRMAVTASNRLLLVMNQTSEINENKSGFAKSIQGDIEFRNVTFLYPGTAKPTLKNISFKVKAGQTIAIVGTTGSGKTTLTKLITRLYDVAKGEILIDGRNVRDFALQNLRQQIGFIEQDVYLFSTTVAENIAFGRHQFGAASLPEIEDAAVAAQAHDFIMALPKQYQTEVGQRGMQLSGGERQRIAIARAILADPRVLVVDDSTSAIDSATEEKIQQAFKRVLTGRTTLLITHRLSQIRWADQILVMRKGEVIAQGTHHELVRTCQEYRNIFIKRFDVDEKTLLEGI
jgi:ATP-binding cassette subfamily B protein